MMLDAFFSVRVSIKPRLPFSDPQCVLCFQRQSVLCLLRECSLFSLAFFTNLFIFSTVGDSAVLRPYNVFTVLHYSIVQIFCFFFFCDH